MVNCACEEHEANKRFIEENAQLKEFLERHKKATAKAQIRSCDLEIINEQFKELLKECKEVFDECFSPSVKHGKLYKKIDEALR